MSLRFAVAGLGLLSTVFFVGAALGATSLSVSTSDITTSSVRVTWSQTQDWCFVDYSVQYRTAGSGTWQEDTSISSETTTSHMITGLVPDTAYEARVVDEDCAGSQASAPAQFRTQSLAVVGALAIGGLFIALIVILVIVAVIVGIVSVIRKATKAAAPPMVPQNAPVYQTNYQQAPPVVAPPPPPPPPPVQPPPPPAQNMPSRFCSQCGSPLSGPFCPKCGHKNW